MQKNKVQIVPDELGNVVRQSSKNSEYGFVRLTQSKVGYSATGWVKSSNLSTLLHGKMEDFKSLGIEKKKNMPGNIVVKESTQPFSQTDPDRDLKYAGDTGVICCSHGEPIYRKCIFDATGLQEDELIPHTNGDAIREANGQTSDKADKAIKNLVSENIDDNQVDLEDSIKEAEAEETNDIIDESSEETEEVIEDPLENESFEL